MKSPHPALDLWRREVNRRVRSRFAFDDLWNAACLEQAAMEQEADGLVDTAARNRREAKIIVRRAVEGQRASA